MAAAWLSLLASLAAGFARPRGARLSPSIAPSRRTVSASARAPLDDDEDEEDADEDDRDFGHAGEEGGRLALEEMGRRRRQLRRLGTVAFRGASGGRACAGARVGRVSGARRKQERARERGRKRWESERERDGGRCKREREKKARVERGGGTTRDEREGTNRWRSEGDERRGLRGRETEGEREGELVTERE
ncbi:hypothetical protein KM043_002075 [Ampulex compressa]|nr:hypothetical protein KM043_002075 [Ampulex compressa]